LCRVVYALYKNLEVIYLENLILKVSFSKNSLSSKRESRYLIDIEIQNPAYYSHILKNLEKQLYFKAAFYFHCLGLKPLPLGSEPLGFKLVRYIWV